MKKVIFGLVVFFALPSFSQNIVPPSVVVNFEKSTSYDALKGFVYQLDSSCTQLKVSVFGKSAQGRDLFVLQFSNSEFGVDDDKIRLLILAQQHGNEQSGKEAALLLAHSLAQPQNNYLFDKIDIAIIPQMNPDGSEINKRRNGNGVDLNRNHLILTEPEVIAVQSVFNKYLFDVTLDVHEYYPFNSEEWTKYGYRKNSDVTLGTTTNINVSEKIRSISNKKILPYHLENVRKSGYSSFEYCPGGPPEVDYIRHSTFDINDGRQSFGIQNTFSFIQEGLNGEDNYVHNLKKRSESQLAGMFGLIEYVYDNSSKIKKIVKAEREKLVNRKDLKVISIQSDHSQNGEKLKIPLYSYYSKKDSMVIVNDYRPVVKSLCDVEKPLGYLIPKENSKLVSWAERHTLQTGNLNSIENIKIEMYFVAKIDSIDFERDIIINPIVDKTILPKDFSVNEYIFIPTSQLKGNMIVLALEPKSMLGLVTYNDFRNLLQVGQSFPILRVVKK